MHCMLQMWSTSCFHPTLLGCASRDPCTTSSMCGTFTRCRICSGWLHCLPLRGSFSVFNQTFFALLHMNFISFLSLVPVEWLREWQLILASVTVYTAAQDTSAVMSSMRSALAIWTTSQVTSTAIILVAVSSLRHRGSSLCHGYAPSSASTPSRTSARLRGIVYPRTWVLSLILDCSENNTFSVWRLMSVDDVSDYAMQPCPIIVIDTL